MRSILFSIINFRGLWEDAGEWKRFGHALSWLALWLGGFFLCLETVAWRLGETVPIQTAAERQINDPRIVWERFREYPDSAWFKLARVAIDRPDVLIMGHSRMSQFRAAMFHPYTFYNMSRAGNDFNAYTILLHHLPPGYKPKVIIFSLDFFMFSDIPAWSRTYDITPKPFSDHIDALIEVFMQVVKHPELLVTNNRDPYYGHKVKDMGVGAHLRSAFRKDGSEQWPGPMMRDRGRSDFTLTKEDYDRWMPNDRMHSNSMASFENFVATARAMSIPLIGVAMPIWYKPNRVFEESPHYGIRKEFLSRIKQGYFDRPGLIFFNLMDYKPYSEDYHYMLDELHSSEAVSANIVLTMMADPRVHAILPKLDTASLAKRLEEERHAKLHIFMYRQTEE